MRKLRTPSAESAPARPVSQGVTAFPQEAEELRRRLAEAEAELTFYRSRHEWMQTALATQRHARQMLEASVSTGYQNTVARIRDTVRSLIPGGATVAVISKGDQELLNLEDQRAWHFPQHEDGGYAGYYPADSAAAIAHLQLLIAQGAEFLLVPNTAFWWLEHYRDWAEWLARFHALVWRDERCAIYKLLRQDPARPLAEAAVSVTWTIARGAAPGPPGASSGVPATASGHRLRPSSPPLPRVPRRTGRELDVPPGIVCFPIIDWDFRFQRPQQLMRQFAKAGSQVFYLSHQFRKSAASYRLRPLATSLWELSLPGPKFNLRHGLLDETHCDCLAAALSEWRRDHVAQATVAVVQSPFWWPLLKRVAATFAWPIVYDCLDHHAGFATSNPVLIEQEQELFSQADLVIASSAWLEQEARRYNRNVLLVRNGCEYEHFARFQPKRRGPRPVIGYYGAIPDWFDSNLVADLAERRTDWDFILVGSTFGAELGRLSKLTNVCFTEERPYAEIPDWLGKFDVAILPFRRTPLTEAANPVKAYEIFASGKPLVSIPLPEMVLLAPLVRLAATAEEFEREIEAELNQVQPHLKRKRRRFARANTWQQRFKILSTAIQDLVAKSRAPYLASLRLKPSSMSIA